jgi:hypothetical protein
MSEKRSLTLEFALKKHILRWLHDGRITRREHLVLLVPDNLPCPEYYNVLGKRIRCIHQPLPVQDNNGTYTATIYLMRRKDWTISHA